MFHHFVGENLSRSERIERIVLEEILNSKVPDSNRENSIAWELKHSSGVIQFARVLALKRELDLEKAVVGAALHDISAIRSGKYAEHAVKGAEIARTILLKEGFSETECNEICDAIASHSDKLTVSKNALSELIKDADLFDCLLYDKNIYYEKPKDVQEAIKNRFRRICKELGIRCFI